MFIFKKFLDQVSKINQETLLQYGSNLIMIYWCIEPTEPNTRKSERKPVKDSNGGDVPYTRYRWSRGRRPANDPTASEPDTADR